MDNLSATPQSEFLGLVASALRKSKDVLNYPGKLPESVPLLGGMGAGDMLLGKGPELMEDMSYGTPPYKGSGWATKVDPRTVDLAFAPGVGTLASTALRGGKAAATAATNVGRREFLKKAGALTAGGAAAVAAPGLLVKALKEAPVLAKEAVPIMAKEAAPAAAVQVARTWTPELLKSILVDETKNAWSRINDPHWNPSLSTTPEELVANTIPEMGKAITTHFTPDQIHQVVNRSFAPWTQAASDTADRYAKVLASRASDIVTMDKKELQKLMPDVPENELDQVVANAIQNGIIEVDTPGWGELMGSLTGEF